MNLVQFFTVFERTASDALAAHKKKMMQIFEQAEFDKDMDLKTVINERNREYDIDRNHMEKQWAMKFGIQAGQDRLDSMKLEAAIKAEKMAIEHALEMKKKEHDQALDMKQREYDQAIDLKKKEEMADVEIQRIRDDARLTTEEKEAKIAMVMFEQIQIQKRERIKADQAIARQGISSTDEQLKEMNRQAHEFRMQLANPQTPTDRLPYISEALKQITEEIKQAQAEGTKRQASAVGGDASVAFMNAEGQKHNLETARQTEDRERAHDIHRRRTDADLMEASKQNVPQYVGSGGTMAPQPAVNVVTVNQDQPHSSQKDACPNCGENVKPKWKVCPGCGASLKKE
jgi:hypothetical protein